MMSASLIATLSMATSALSFSFHAPHTTFVNTCLHNGHCPPSVQPSSRGSINHVSSLFSTQSDDETEQPPPSIDRERTKTDLLLIASRSDRGQSAIQSDKDSAMQMIESLESVNPHPQPLLSVDQSSSSSASSAASVLGTWEVIFSSTQLFRSSPFFMAGRAVCQTEDEARQYDWFCDMHRGALAISTIGKVRQIISPTRMVSEFEVKAGGVPFLSDFTPFAYSGGWPVTIDGAIVSSADIETVEDGNAWEIFMDTVEIKGSNLPLLRQVLDAGLKLQSRGLGQFLEENVNDYTNPKPIFRTTYLDDDLRISRDQDGKVFVYARVSNETEPTDYSSIMSDLGVGKILEGFNDSITKYYL